MKKTDNNAILGFLLPIAAGTAGLELVTVIIFLLIGKFSLAVIWGALWGTAVMLLYYWLMARAVTKAAEGDPEAAKKRIQASYSMRMLMLMLLMGAGLYISTAYEVINWIPMLLAVIYPRISIAVWQAVSLRKNKENNNDDEGEGENA